MNWGDDNLDALPSSLTPKHLRIKSMATQKPDYTFFKGMCAGILLTAALIVLGNFSAKRAAAQATNLPVCERWENTIIPKYGPSGALIDEIPAVVCLEYAAEEE